MKTSSLTFPIKGGEGDVGPLLICHSLTNHTPKSITKWKPINICLLNLVSCTPMSIQNRAPQHMFTLVDTSKYGNP
jgi:hypothetical protein